MHSLKQFPLSQTRIIIQRDIDTVVHGDDLIAVAEDGQLDHFEHSMEIKRVGRIGPGRPSTGKVLKSVVHWSGDGFTWEADTRLMEKLINMLNLSGGKGALTLGGKDIGRDVCVSDCELECSDAKHVQAAAGLEQYIALDRPDVAYSVKTTLQQMSKPTKLMQLRVVQVGRYRKNNSRLFWKFQYQQQPKSIDMFVDADIADRDNAEVHVWSCGVRASTEHGRSRVPRSDASAGIGIGIASRQGCGRLKHLEVKWLWVQEKVSEKALRLRKHPTETNTAHLATKYLTRPRMEMLLAAGNLVLSGEGERMVRTP